MQSLACLNGELMPTENARVSIWDRGFLFGDAVYEVFRLYEGRGWIEEEHMDRLARSLKAMHYEGIDLERLTERIHHAVSLSEISEGTVYIQITRGAVSPRRHAFPDASVVPTELIVVNPYDDAATAALREAGVELLSQPDWRWKRCDVKSTNLLANVLAHDAAHRAGAYEAILVDSSGMVTEATHSSVLWVRGGRLEATPEGPEILPGTTRRFVEQLAAENGIPFTATHVTLAQLKAADEVILVGTTIEVLPVVRVDGAAVGNGQPGTITRRLQLEFRRAVEAWLAPQPV
jgi:D-alanine transaminase